MSIQRQAMIWMISGIVFLLLVFVLRDVLMPFVAGMVIAYLLDPLADKLEAKGLSRLSATIVITVGFFLLLLIGLAILLPTLQVQILGFSKRLPDYLNALRGFILPLIEQFQLVAPDAVDKIRDATGGYIGTMLKWLGGVLAGLLSGGMAIVNILSLLVLTPLVTFYFIRDWDVMVAKIDGWLPRDSARSIREIMGDINITLSGFVRGQSTVCFILGVFYALGLSLIGLDFGLVVGIVAGLISFIPYFGSLLGFGTGLAIAIAQFGDWQHPLMVVAVFGIGQLAEGNFLTPKLVGDKVGLHPVWVIFALLAGGSLFGFTGVMLAVPVAAVIGVVVRFALKQYLDSPFYKGNSPA
ncbi:MAG: AI-2E family transporter [Magnetospiraceae bacterium]